jgi:hypothetical protein
MGKVCGIGLKGRLHCTVENPPDQVEAARADAYSMKPGLSHSEARVFIPLGGAKRHADSQDWLPH